MNFLNGIEPNGCPGGIVFQVFTLDGRMILERRMRELDSVEEIALDDADQALEISGGEPVTLVAYDGDSGQRLLIRAGIPHTSQGES